MLNKTTNHVKNNFFLQPKFVGEGTLDIHGLEKLTNSQKDMLLLSDNVVCCGKDPYWSPYYEFKSQVRDLSREYRMKVNSNLV